MADKYWTVILQVTIRERDTIMKAIRPVTLPFVPFPGLSISFKNLNFRVNGLDFDYENQVFTAYECYPGIEPEELERVVAIYRENGFDVSS